MTTLYLTEPYSAVQRWRYAGREHSGQRKDRRGEAQRTVPLIKVDQVVVMGDSTVTTPALLALLEQNAEVCFCDFWGRFKGRLAPEVSKNVFVRTAQFRRPSGLSPARASGRPFCARQTAQPAHAACCAATGP